jgi:hypothetical protein
MDNQPITLTAEEFTMLMSELASRDPVMRGLMLKQDQAQRQAQQNQTAPIDSKVSVDAV